MKSSLRKDKQRSKDAGMWPVSFPEGQRHLPIVYFDLVASFLGLISTIVICLNAEI